MAYDEGLAGRVRDVLAASLVSCSKKAR